MILVPARYKPKTNNKKIVLYSILSIALLLSGLLATLYYIQPSIAFNHGKSKKYHHPNSTFKNHWLPDQLGMTYKNLTIKSPVKNPMANPLTSEDEYDNLYGWFIYHEGISAQIPTLIYFHENDYFPPARLYMIEKMFKNPQKYNVIMVDYRGYGYSQGTSTEEGIYSDCHAIMDYVLQMKEIDQSQVFIFGASIGGAFATYSALNYQDKVKGLILQNTFVSVESLIFSKLSEPSFLEPFTHHLLDHLLRIKLPTDTRIPMIKLPMMFIVGLNDTATGPQQMYDLYGIANKTATFTELYEVKGSDHYLPWYYGGEEYDTRLSDFISKSLGEEKQEAEESTIEMVKKRVFEFGTSIKFMLENVME